MACLLKKRTSALPIPREKGRMTMATSLLSSVKSCEGGHGLRHHLLDGHLLSSVESCGGGPGIIL